MAFRYLFLAQRLVPGTVDRPGSMDLMRPPGSPALALVQDCEKRRSCSMPDWRVCDALDRKSYLGWPRHPWDPMLLGLLLAGVALVVRRWLAAGPNGERGGFTPVRVLAKDADAIRLVGIASAGIHQPAVAPAAPDAGGFGGGRSGGGGSGADY